MPYTSRCTTGELTGEERDVQAALSRYTTTEATYADWVPTRFLYRDYWHWLGQHRWDYDPYDLDAPDRLTKRQFGHAVRRVFPDIQRCYRSYHGKHQWGYAGLIGPDATRSRWLARAAD